MDHYGPIILSKVPTLRASMQHPIVLKADNWSRQLYWDRYRFNGEPFYTHTNYVSEVVAAFRPDDPHAIAGAKMHDGEEDFIKVATNIRARFHAVQNGGDLAKLEQILNAELPLFAEYVNIRADRMDNPIDEAGEIARNFSRQMSVAIGDYRGQIKPVNMDALAPVLNDPFLGKKITHYIATKIMFEFGKDDERVVRLLTRVSNEETYNQAFADPGIPLRLRQTGVLIKCPDAYHNDKTLDFDGRLPKAKKVLERGIMTDPFLKHIAEPDEEGYSRIPGLYGPMHEALRDAYEELCRRDKTCAPFEVRMKEAQGNFEATRAKFIAAKFASTASALS